MYKMGYLGPPGTFTQEALFKYIQLPPEEIKEYSTISEVIRAIGKEVEWGIVPVENSLEGSVNITLDILARETNLVINGEVIIPVSHHLLGKEGGTTGDVKHLYSHPQAVAQCRKFIEKHLPQSQTELTLSTAQAARLISERRNDNTCAAIGTRRAADLYGLKVLEENIHDYDCNYTRFIVLSLKHNREATGKDKTSLVFGIKDGPGALYQVLKEFALRQLNLTRIESRPSKRNFGDYLFFVDLEGHLNEPKIKETLESVGENTVFLRVLGSYPQGEMP
ncbi:prephenate dehydratase [Candidatus Contubernalis alkaliaceticus]|uniref:prephenate dehydratase n=1 Tax=Candidatus Contubernalis alkaliaceticus TaxID=338645 RepID=UPI001F4C28FA|nr:prephenate dehydratase [Candidatus Contubernalis alkalaceticus]UNC90702.1 prephenate dehydratase [Candidatus Contubernalis alkalaceticus]